MGKKSSRPRTKQRQQTSQVQQPQQNQTSQQPRQPRQTRGRAARRSPQMSNWWVFGVIAILVLAVLLIGYYSIRSHAQTQTSTTASGTPVNSLLYPSIDNITCDASNPAYHVHAHLTLYINGAQVQIPQGIGLPTDQSCIYWLHTHDTSGVIHIEAPRQQNYLLGTFIDLWAHQFPQLQYPVQLSQTEGWTAWVNGKPYNGDFRNISLTAHTLITLAYNSPGVTPDTIYNWPAGE
jgi:hypothetical protein